MAILTPEEKINIYRNVFKGREDVFAKYWQKADKSVNGYTPVCLNEWRPGVCNKTKGMKCKDCTQQNYIGLNEKYLEKHLRGSAVYGIYPLLDDNTSYFIAVDFDGKSWQKNIADFYRQCKKNKLPVYVERSRSGQGGHAWVFFEDKYPAYKSRNIIVNILKEIRVIDQFDREDSFDRLFPNQDTLSGKGLGNLICLPLQGECRKQGNTTFLDPENDFIPYKDQWSLLQTVNKVPVEKLDKLYGKFNKNEPINRQSLKTNLQIIISEQVHLSKNKLPKILINYLRDNLNFFNLEFLIKQRIGISTYGMEKYFKLVQTEKDSIVIPRGFLGDLIDFLNRESIRFNLVDERIKCQPIKLTSGCQLFDYQEKAVKMMLEAENGILVAPSGSGKTIIGIELIAKLKQPALILAHKRQIFNQWVERVESFLNIPKREIGQICSSKKTIGKAVTVAMVQTLNKQKGLGDKFSDKIGLVLVDECHHMPAKMFRNVITGFKPYYLYGLTATPTRKNNDEKLIFIYLGQILHSIKKEDLTGKKEIKALTTKTKLVIRNTNIQIPFKVKVDNFQVLSKIIVFDSNRNQQVANDIISEVSKGFKCLVLTERKEHVEVLSYYFKKEYEVIMLTGDLTPKQRKERIKQIEDGHFQILLATGQLIGEGADFPNLDCLFLVYPFSFHGKLTQYIGRIQRGDNPSKIIYDYRDIKIAYLEKFYKSRMRYYKKFLI